MNELNITNFSKKDQKLILKGYYFAKKMHDTYTKPRLSGEPYSHLKHFLRSKNSLGPYL